MYDAEYAKKWINNHESGKDIFRTQQLEPVLKEYLQELPENASVLDVGCGWGMLLELLPKVQPYTGVDINSHFFEYIRAKYLGRALTLLEGKLPDQLNLNSKFDLVFCCLTLHCLGELALAIQNLHAQVSQNGNIVLIDFADKAKERLQNTTYEPILESRPDYIKGVAALPSGEKVITETYFHSESAIETELYKYALFEKRYIGDLFVMYYSAHVSATS